MCKVHVCIKNEQVFTCSFLCTGEKPALITYGKRIRCAYSSVLQDSQSSV